MSLDLLHNTCVTKSNRYTLTYKNFINKDVALHIFAIDSSMLNMERRRISIAEPGVSHGVALCTNLLMEQLSTSIDTKPPASTTALLPKHRAWSGGLLFTLPERSCDSKKSSPPARS